MFGQCAGDAAPGSSQTAFGSGSLLLAPLSNFRAGTLPTTVSLPHSHKPETDSLPACLAARSPSPQSPLSLSISLCLCVSLSLVALSLPAFFFFLPAELAPSSFLCLCLVLCLQDYRSAVSLTACKSCCTLPLSLVSSLPLSLSLSLSLSHPVSQAPTVGSLVGCKYPCYISILIAQVSQGPGIYFLHIYFIVLARCPDYFWLDLTTNILLHGPVHYQQRGVSLFKKVTKGSICSS